MYNKYIKYKIKYLNLCKQVGGDKFKLSSQSIKNNERINDKFTQYYDNQQPLFEWSNVPNGTKDLLLICYDPDAVNGTWIHWIVNIDPNTNKLIDGHYKLGLNSYNERNYRGPKPPIGTGIHHYHFKLFALNDKFNDKKYTYNELVKSIQNMIIGETEIIGTYSK